MGLLGDSLDWANDGMEWVSDTGRGIIKGTTGIDPCVFDCEPIPQDDSDPIVDGVSDTENNINNGVGDATDKISDRAGDGADTVFDVFNGGADAIQGLLNWFAGSGDTMSGLGHWVENNGDIIPIAGGALEFIGAFIGGVGDVISGFFHGLAGGVGAIEGLFAILSGISGLEGAAFLLGGFLMLIGAYLIISGILSGEVLLLSSYAEDAFDAVMAFLIGTGLVVWTFDNLMGAIFLAGMATVLVFYSIISEEGQLVIFGAPLLFVGYPMLFAALKVGAVATVVLTIAVLFTLVWVTEFLEKDVATTVNEDRSLLSDGGKK